MIPYGAGELRSRRRRKKNNSVVSIIVLAAIIGGLAFIALRARHKRSSPDDLYAAAGLGVAGIGFICFQAGVQDSIDRLMHHRSNARERQFWKDRQAKERQQQMEQERLDREAAERRALRRAEARRLMGEIEPEDSGKSEG